VTHKIEQRTFSGVQLRAAADFTLQGIAAPYNTWSGDLGGFKEQIRPGAFARALREKQDVKCLFNHDADYVYGRVKNGTLTLRDTAAGLAFTNQLDKKNSRHQALYASVERGDVDECSFAFQLNPGGDVWNDARTQRTLIDIAKLYDVSVVCYPAYTTGTSVDARQLRSAAQYVAPQDWRSKHMAALAKLELEIANDKFAAALEDAKQAINEARRTL